MTDLNTVQVAPCIRENKFG